MTPALERALTLLNENNATLAAAGNGFERVYFERGIKPLLNVFDSGMRFSGLCAADKVVGKAAAMMYVLLDVSEVFAFVISKPALATLEEHDIKCEYETLVDAVRNRTDTGFCPMETAVKDISDPLASLEIIRKKLAELQKIEKTLD